MPSKETQTGVGMVIGLIVVVALAPLVMAAPNDAGPGHGPTSMVPPEAVLTPLTLPDTGVPWIPSPATPAGGEGTIDLTPSTADTRSDGLHVSASAATPNGSATTFPRAPDSPRLPSSQPTAPVPAGTPTQTPAPAVSATPSTAPMPVLTPPSSAPTPDPTPAPTPDPTPAPTPDPTPAPTPPG